jgi:uncharacterized damage-inducible protein DinB
MKNTFLSVLCLLLVTLGSTFGQSQPTSGYLTTEWQRAKEFTLEYLNAMPEDGYNFKPTPEMRTFAQQFLHLAIDNYGFTATITGKTNPYPNSDETEKDPSLQSKAAVTKFVLDSYDFAINGLTGLTAAQLQEKIGKRSLPREQYFFKAFEHQTHHRGQATVYLRLKGVKPPNEKLF